MEIHYKVHRKIKFFRNIILKNIFRLSLQKWENFIQYKQDKRCSTFTKSDLYPTCKLYNFFHPSSHDLIRSRAQLILALGKNYIEHFYDLLGSGWIQVKHGIHCRGFEGFRYAMDECIEIDSEGNWLEDRINPSNLPDSRAVWRLVDEGYIPIDWHIDFKSGYRWSENTWYRDIHYGHKSGVDIKVPWELARMQHLPQLAYAYELSKVSYFNIPHQQKENRSSSDFVSPERYVREFRNQVLDFIATNPPRFGVNWSCTMDVAIRISNWIVAYDLFHSYGAKFDKSFIEIFTRSIYEHGWHILNNLEWSENFQGNHYLSGIVGLLFVAAYLVCTPKIDAWLAFAVKELVKQVKLQFYNDGANFEGSTSYHQLSAELVLYGTALILGLPDEKRKALLEYDESLIEGSFSLHPAPIPHYQLPIVSKTFNSQRLFSPFPSWYFERLEKMAEFTMHITKPNNYIPQIGDNDSGRFLKLQPVYKKMTVKEAKETYSNLIQYNNLPDEEVYWQEDTLQRKHIVAAINGLFQRKDFKAFTGQGWLEEELISKIIGGVVIQSYKSSDDMSAAEKVYISTDNSWKYFKEKLNSLPETQRQIMSIPIPGKNITEGLHLYAYPYFGLYIYKSKRLYLAVRCGPVGQNGNGGHAHNDQLSFELNVDGDDWITDPGTYVYTPLSRLRNQYRSVNVHFAPQVKGMEPGKLNLGLFRLNDEASAECLCFNTKFFIGRHWGFDSPVYRAIKIENNLIKLFDYSEGMTISQQIKPIRISPGYGILLR